jgi:hypothetical protein
MLLEQIPWPITMASTVSSQKHLMTRFSLPMTGIIRFKMVIHAFIDGKSRFVTGVRVSNNNRAETVLNMFMEVVNNHGVPSRVRGDYGTENVLVAEWMEETMGLGRGSYIWGRFVKVLVIFLLLAGIVLKQICT